MQQVFVIIKGKTMGSHFVCFHEVIINCCPKCYYLLIFSPWVNQVVKLFRRKENFKKKVDSDSNWKTAWPRMSLKWYLFLRLSLGFVRNFFSFVGKHPISYPKDVTSMSKKYIKNEIFNFISQKAKEQSQGRKNIIQLHNYNF